MLASQQIIAEGPAQVLSVDCIVMDLFPATGKESSVFVRTNYVKLVLFAILPFLIYLISKAFWKCYSCCKRILPQDREDKGTATAIIVLFLFYPSIVAVMGKSVNCV